MATYVKDAGFAVVESFVGMNRKPVGGRGIKIEYLVKWHGYGYAEATWEETHTMGLPNPGYFVEKFEKEARKEGIDISEWGFRSVLLRCAIEAGWNSNGTFIKKEPQ